MLSNEDVVWFHPKLCQYPNPYHPSLSQEASAKLRSQIKPKLLRPNPQKNINCGLSGPDFFGHALIYEIVITKNIQITTVNINARDLMFANYSQILVLISLMLPCHQLEMCTR